MPEAGWYQDPHNPEQQRYWDGTTWTEHTHDAPFTVPQPPGPGQPSYGPPGTHPGFINNIGDWLGRSFSVLFANAAPLFILLVVGILPSMAPYWGAWRVIENMTLQFDGFDEEIGLPTDVTVSGYSNSALTTALLVWLAAIVFTAFLSLAQSHILHRGHVARPARFSESLSAAAKGLPRYIGWWLLIVVGAMAIWAAIMFLLLSLGPIGILLGVLVGLAAIPLAVWLWVKLSFLSISAAVAPKGQSALRASTDRSKSVFWGVFGRLLLLAIITIVVGGIVQSFSSPAFLSGVTADAGGGLVINGTPLEDMSELRLADLFPFNNATVIALTISGLLAGAVGLYSRSGLAGLYVDLNGPSDEPEAETETSLVES